MTNEKTKVLIMSKIEKAQHQFTAYSGNGQQGYIPGMQSGRRMGPITRDKMPRRENGGSFQSPEKNIKYNIIYFFKFTLMWVGVLNEPGTEAPRLIQC